MVRGVTVLNVESLSQLNVVKLSFIILLIKGGIVTRGQRTKQRGI